MFTFRLPKRQRLTSSLAAALGFSLSMAMAQETPDAGPSRSLSHYGLHPQNSGIARLSAGGFGNTPPQFNGPSRTVSNCTDDGNNPGSLRYEIEHASSGDTIDLSMLACSTITLGSEIDITQYSLRIQGPGSNSLTIDGNSHSRIFNNPNPPLAGTLGLYDLTIANGYYRNNGDARGGCINFNANVLLFGSVVTHCTLVSASADPTTDAKGGGIFANYMFTASSTITGNEAYGQMSSFGYGGAAWVGSLHSKYSTISDNKAFNDNIPCSSQIGGISSHADVKIEGSTISGNSACHIGALGIGGGGTDCTISNSTISGNVASHSDSVGGILTNCPLSLVNSTVAFNRADGGGTGGIFLSQDAPLTLQSAIVADNGAFESASDVDGTAGATIGGSDNLVIASGLPLPANTLQDCPRLQPLAQNGGLTLTHAPMQASPAIDRGNNDANLTHDQRGQSRVVGASADIGSVERQPGEVDDRLLVSGFDGLCDQ